MSAPVLDHDVNLPTSDDRTKRSAPPLVAAAPDGGWGWLVVLGSVLTHVIVGGQERSNGVLYLRLLEKFERSAALTAWVISMCTSFQLLIGPVSGALINRYSSRSITITGGLLLALAFIISCLATKIEYLFFSYSILGGIGKSFTYSACIIIVGQYFDKKRGLAVGISTAGVGLGTFIYPPLLELSFEKYSFFGTMLIMGGIAFHLCACGMLYRPLRQKEQLTLKQSEKDIEEPLSKSCDTNILTTSELEVTAGAEAKILISDELLETAECETPISPEDDISIDKRRRKNYPSNKLLAVFNNFIFTVKSGLELLFNIHFLLFCLNICLFTTAHWSIPVFLPALAKEKGISEMDAALLISITGIADLLSRIILGMILDLKYVRPYRRFVFNAVIGMQVVMMMLCPYALRFWHFAIVSVFYGCLSGSTIAQLSIILVDLFGVQNLATSFGWLQCFQGIGLLIGPPISGKMRDIYKNYRELFFFSGGIMAVGLLFLMISTILSIFERKKIK